MCVSSMHTPPNRQHQWTASIWHSQAIWRGWIPPLTMATIFLWINLSNPEIWTLSTVWIPSVVIHEFLTLQTRSLGETQNNWALSACATFQTGINILDLKVILGLESRPSNPEPSAVCILASVWPPKSEDLVWILANNVFRVLYFVKRLVVFLTLSFFAS